MRVVRMAIDKLEQSRLDELSKRKIDAVVPLAESGIKIINNIVLNF